MDTTDGPVIPFDRARRFRRERLRQGDSVAEFARRLGVPRARVEAWEAGREQPHPDVRLLLNPQRVFSVDNPPPPEIRELLLRGLEEKLAELSDGEQDSEAD